MKMHIIILDNMVKRQQVYRDKRGARTEPWGMPQSNWAVEEVEFWEDVVVSCSLQPAGSTVSVLRSALRPDRNPLKL